MSVVGLACKDRKRCYEAVSRRNLEKMIADTAVLPLMQGKVTGFQKQWKIPGLSV